MRRVVLALLVASCGHKGDDCDRAVDHLFWLLGSDAKGDERKTIHAIAAATKVKCRSEGLPHDVAECIVAAHNPDWNDQLRACPAFAAHPPSWVSTGPSREERAALRGGSAVPDGPREGPVHYKQLVGGIEGTCGLRPDGSLVCWSVFDDAPLSPPAGAFLDVAPTYQRGCALATDHTITCFGPEAPAQPKGTFRALASADCAIASDGTPVCWRGDHPLPKGPLVALSCDGDCCGITADHHLACTGDRLGAPPAGSFETVMTIKDHACAVRTGGGTVCWGENDLGGCNVPQK